MTASILAACNSGDLSALTEALASDAPLDERTTSPARTSVWTYGGQSQASDAQLTGLHVAALEGHGAVVAALVAAGADLEATTKGGRTALLTASLAGKLEVVDALLAGGANVSAVDTNGMSALHGAATEGHASVVARLIDGKVPLDLPAFGVGAVHHAGIELIQLRGTVHGRAEKTTDGRTVRIREGRVTLDAQECSVETLRELSADAVLDDATRRFLGVITSARLLCEAGANRALENGGNTAQHTFAEIGEPLLIAHVDAWTHGNANGTTPSHLLATCRRVDGVKAGLAGGADLSARNAAGLSPIHFFADKGGPVAVLEALIEAGADPKDRITGSGTYPEGWTAVDIAKKWNDDDTVSALQRLGGR